MNALSTARKRTYPTAAAMNRVNSSVGGTLSDVWAGAVRTTIPRSVKRRRRGTRWN